MKLATAPVNWNNADVTDYRPWVPYPALLDEMVAAGYNATEWGMNMERDAAKQRADLQERGLQMLGGLVGLELRNDEERDQEIARALAKYGNRVGYVHIKDVDGQVLQKSRENGWSFAQALKSYIFAPLGEGIARVPEVIDALRQAGYTGWLVIEQDTTPDDPTIVAAKNRRYLEPLIK